MSTSLAKISVTHEHVLWNSCLWSNFQTSEPELAGFLALSEDKTDFLELGREDCSNDGPMEDLRGVSMPLKQLLCWNDDVSDYFGKEGAVKVLDGKKSRRFGLFEFQFRADKDPNFNAVIRRLGFVDNKGANSHLHVRTEA